MEVQALTSRVHTKGESYMSEFPAGKKSALAVLVLQNRDLTNLTPTQIAELYETTYSELDKYYKKLNEEQHDAFYGKN